MNKETIYEYITENRDQNENLINAILWLLSDDTGISSETLLACALGIKPTRGFISSYPSDPADLGRCIRMMETLDWVRKPAFEVLKNLGSNSWRNLVANWDELEKLYFEELASGTAPRTFERMRELIVGDRLGI